MTRKRFKKLSQKWHAETGFHSSIAAIMDNDAIIEIIDAGEIVIPFIIEEMEETLNGHWSTALSQITDCNVIPKHHYGKVEYMAKDWIHWYKYIYLSGTSICGK